MIQLKGERVRIITFKGQDCEFDVEDIFARSIGTRPDGRSLAWYGGYKIPITSEITISIACGMGSYSYSECHKPINSAFHNVEMAFVVHQKDKEGVVSEPRRVNGEELLKWLIITKPLEFT